MGKVCNILNLTEQEKYFQTEYKNLSEKIARDTSKDIYNNLIEKLGLNKYANPDSLAASTFSAIGNIGGIIGLTLLTGGAAGAIFGEATGAAVVATEVANGAIMATSNMGSETERALLNGASMEEASFIGLGSGLIGALTAHHRTLF